MFRNIFFENLAAYEIMWKNIVQPYRPRMTTYYGICTLHDGELRLQTHVQNI
jgi:hypothetical protein